MKGGFLMLLKSLRINRQSVANIAWRYGSGRIAEFRNKANAGTIYFFFFVESTGIGATAVLSGIIV